MLDVGVGGGYIVRGGGGGGVVDIIDVDAEVVGVGGGGCIGCEV